MNKHYWTGIGSRSDINIIISQQQNEIGSLMSKKGWTLLTGGAKGSDFNFLDGSCITNDTKSSIVIRPLNFPNFKGKSSHPCIIEYMEYGDFERAKDYYFSNNIFNSKQFLKMPKVVQHLHARNFYQIMDENGIVRSEFVAYAAKEGRWGNISGGTRTAVSVARIENIPVFNIKLKGQYEALHKFMEGLPNVE